MSVIGAKRWKWRQFQTKQSNINILPRRPRFEIRYLRRAGICSFQFLSWGISNSQIQSSNGDLLAY